MASTPETSPFLGRFGLAAGPLLALLAAWLLPESLTFAGRATAALALWMAVWWMTEAVSLYATALLPLAFLPLFGAGSAKEAAAPYGNELIYLFLGGFLLALSMQASGLDRRLAFAVVRLMGTRASALVFGLMAVTAFISMWMSNTATMLTIYPIALSVLTLARGAVPAPAFRNFAHALLLGVAYASSIGGLGTLIGTPPNLILASYARDVLGLEIGFMRWMAVSVPLVAVFLPAAAWLLLRCFPVKGLRIEGVTGLAETTLREMGPPSRAEKVTLGVFALAAAAWIARPFLTDLTWGGLKPFAGLGDSGIAILAALLLFVIPAGTRAGGVLTWDTAKKVPFGILLLFGGGLSLASALERNGVTQFLGDQLGALQGVPLWGFLPLAVFAVIFVGELLSNTAMAAALMPLAAATAQAAGWDVAGVLVALTWAASCGFMLPVATPPNAVAYGSGEIDGRAMLRAGFWLNLLGGALVVAAALWILPLAFG